MSPRPLSPAKQKLLERLRRGQSNDAPSPVQRDAARPPAPLSFAQQRLWFLEELLPRTGVYTTPFGFLLQGQLDVAVLERCLAEIVRRHEPLRTTFPMVDGRPVQHVVEPSRDANAPGSLLAIDDISGGDDADRQTRAIAWLHAEARRPFDLVNGPLFAARLLRLADDEHLFLFNTHHIACDAWSYGILAHELCTLYPAFARGLPSPLSPLPMGYTDFTRAQHEQMRTPAFERHLDYWKTKLGKAPPVLDMLGDRPRPPRQAYAGGLVRRRLDGTLSAGLARLSQKEGVTLFITLLAAFKLLLQRYTRQNDILIGSTIAGRSDSDVEPLFGFFANTVVLRTDLSNDPTFRELLARVRTTVFEASDHQDLPFELLVSEYQLARDVSHNPLFQVMFALQNSPLDPVSRLDDGLMQAIFHQQGAEPCMLPHAGVVLDPMELHPRTSKFDLWLSMAGGENGLGAVVEYDSDLFDRDTIERLFDHFEVLLQGIVDDPEQRLSQLPILPNAERERLVAEWNATAVDYPNGRKLLHEPFEMRAAENPSAVALRFDDRELTYGELDRRANQLAHELRDRGVGPEVLVGVYAERSFAMMISLLAVLKAGGAYVPLDPTYPADRLAFMLTDTNAKVLLVQRSLMPQLATWRGPAAGSNENTTVVVVDDEPVPGSAKAPARSASGDHLAYIMYTSGSTGHPKGVMIRHRNIVNTLEWMQAEYPLTPADRVLQKTPFTFDVSLLEFFQTLGVGACLVLARPGGHKDAAYLAQLCQTERITTLHFVASMLQVFLEDPEAPNCRSLRRVFASGEALSYRLMEQFYERMTFGPELHNMYGPTEISIEATFWACRLDGDRPVVPIGRPIGNTRVYIVDEHLQPVPIGKPGELCIGGAGVARGYLNRPELTAEKFPLDPFTSPSKDGEAAHLYRTGDLVRYRQDGMIDFLGRLDDQVKVRGFRIELGEVEAAFRQQPNVKDVVVTAREEADRKSLVAYVVADGDGPGASAHRRLEHVGNWEATFDDAYRPPASGRARNPEDDFSGWNSSYTGKPLPEEAMREWVDSTVSRIRALQPSRVLELGCGTGLFLLRLAKDCDVYHATDISKVAVETLEAEVRTRGLSHVELAQRAAHEFEAAPGTYDVVLLNSVVQYFPTLEYLVEVLEKACRALRPGGAIFLGDLRSLPLLELFHTAVEVAKAPASRTIEQLRLRIRSAIAKENELVIDPEFFSNAMHQIPALAPLVCERIVCKRGSHHNELTQFRYDVIVRRGDGVASGGPRAHGDRKSAGGTSAPRPLEDIRRYLETERPLAFELARVPDARLASAREALELVCKAEKGTRAGGLRQALASAARTSAIDPETLFVLGEELGYDVDVIARTDAPGHIDARFRKPGAAQHEAVRPAAPPRASDEPLERYATQPLRERLAAALFPVWRKGLQRVLPDFMIPPVVVLVDVIPIGPHGKVDRSALPAPAPTLSEIEVEYVAPRSPAEETLAGIWAEVLGLESVGIRNNFFALGGDSIRSIQAVARARRVGLNVTVEQLFRNQTIAELGAALTENAHATEAKGAESPAPGRFSTFDLDLEGLDVEDVYPVSPKQAYLIEQQHAQPELGLYTLFSVLRGPGLHVPTLERAYQALIDRHPALRTSFSKTPSGQYVQVVHRGAKLPLEEHDWRDVPPDDVETKLRAYIDVARARGYELDDCPKMRIAVFRTADDHHIVVYGFNYLQVDGWSNMVMMKEVQSFYEAIARGGELPTFEDVPSPRAFIERIARQDASVTENYWRKKWRGFRRPTNLIERLGPPSALAENDTVFAKQHMHLDRSMTERLADLSREERVTLNTLVHGAWALLLAEYTNKEDVVYGAVVSGRAPEIPGIEDMVGLFTNVLPVRPPLPSRFPTLRAWLRTLQDDLLELRSHEHSSLSDVKTWSELPERARLFESYIVFENIPRDETIAKNMDPTSPFTLAQLGFPLRVEVWPGAQVLILLHYYRRHFRDDVITKVLRDLERAMTFILGGLDQPPRLEHAGSEQTV